MTRDIDNVELADHAFGKLPDHLLIEIFIRVPVLDWVHISCVKQQWANLFRGECLWQSALLRTWPSADQGKRWPGPIPRGLSKRRYAALYVSKHIFACDGEIDEIMGHTYLFLKEELELSTMPPPSGILHGTIIDQFIACGKSRDKAHELASQIWLAVIDNLEENEHTFLLLKRLAQEGDIFLPYPYSRSYKIQWRVFEKLFTDFRDCFNRVDYYDILACAKYKFQPIPSAWLVCEERKAIIHRQVDEKRELSLLLLIGCFCLIKQWMCDHFGKMIRRELAALQGRERIHGRPGFGIWIEVNPEPSPINSRLG